MKKKIISVLIIAMMVTGTCSSALAADTKGEATRDNLKSYGAIEYRKGSDKVIIHSDDLYMLADQIDQVKVDVSDQLEAMNTYFTAGDGIDLSTDRYISVTHTRPPRADFVDPLSINFDTLLEGIAASQSVSPNVTDYGYSSGTRLYRKEDGSLTTNGSETGATQIDVTVATADNLSAGTAAWVNGRLILGTGGDNKSYFDQGYEKGVEENPGSGGSGDSGADINKAQVINLKGSDNKGTSYLIQNDMQDIFLLFQNGSTNISLDFETQSGDPVVQFKELHKSTESNAVSQCLYYVPTIKAGTLIKFDASRAVLLCAKKPGENKSPGVCINLRGDDKDQTSYLVREKIQDSYIMCIDNNNYPSFETLPGDPIVAQKQLTQLSLPGAYGIATKISVYYIPEIKQGTTINNFGNGYLFY